jgi:hypothetical protein
MTPSAGPPVCAPSQVEANTRPTLSGSASGNGLHARAAAVFPNGAVPARTRG